jgi:hypothetical protein
MHQEMSSMVLGTQFYRAFTPLAMRLVPVYMVQQLTAETIFSGL